MFEQDPAEIDRVCKNWLADVAAGRRPGRKFFEGESGSQNGAAIADYVFKTWHFYSAENLDKAVAVLAKSNRFQGHETSIDRDISTPGVSHGQMSAPVDAIEALEKLRAKIMGGKRDEAAKHEAEETYDELPRRDLSQAEMANADKRALRSWLEWKHNADRRSF